MGVVVVSEDPAYFTSDFYNVASIGHEGVIAVVSDSGSVLARSTGGDTVQNASSIPVAKGSGARNADTADHGHGAFSASGVYPTADHASGIYVDPIDHVKRIVSYRHIDGYPLGVLVGPEREEMTDYNHMRNVYLLMAAFISLARCSASSRSRRG